MTMARSDVTPLPSKTKTYCRWSCDQNGANWRDGAGRALPTYRVQREAHSELPRELVEEAYREYADQGHGNQSLERLNERGGFGVGEVLMLLYDRINRLQGALK